MTSICLFKGPVKSKGLPDNAGLLDTSMFQLLIVSCPAVSSHRRWGSQAKGRNGAKCSFLSSLDAHLPWSKLGACLGGPGGAGWSREGSRRWWWEQGFLQLLGHLAGQLFSRPGSYVWQGCLAYHSLWELHDAKMPGRIRQFFWATVLVGGGAALGTRNLQTDCL